MIEGEEPFLTWQGKTVLMRDAKKIKEVEKWQEAEWIY